MAYPVHLKRTLKGIFSPLDDLLLKILGFGADDAIRFCDGIESLTSRRVDIKFQEAAEGKHKIVTAVESYRQNRVVPAGHGKEFIERLAGFEDDEVDAYVEGAMMTWVTTFMGPTLLFTAAELSQETHVPLERAEAFVRQMSLQFGTVESKWYRLPSPTPPLHIKPLIRLGPSESREAGHARADETFFCPVPLAILWSLRPNIEQSLNPQSPDPAPLTDQVSWMRYEHSRSQYLQQRTMALLSEMLKGSTSLSALRYNAPNLAGSTEEAELDGLLLIDDALFLVEVKAGSITPAARRGGQLRMLRDLKSLVSEAQNQAGRARSYIESQTTPVFRVAGGDEYTCPNEIDRKFLINVTLEPLDAFVTNMYELEELGVLGQGHAQDLGFSSTDKIEGSRHCDLPWSVSIYDLEIFHDIIEYPSELVHYLDRRLLLNKTKKRVRAHSELDFFGRYLVGGLDFRAEFEANPVDQIELHTHTTLFDDYYLYKYGGRQTPAAKPAQPLPGPLSSIIVELERRQPSGYLRFTDILYDISHDMRPKFAERIQNCHWLATTKRRFSDASFVDFRGTFGITYMAAPPGTSYDELERRLRSYVYLKKYQVKAERWLGIGGIGGTKQIAQIFFLNSEPWHPDPKCQELVDRYLPRLPDNNAVKSEEPD